MSARIIVVLTESGKFAGVIDVEKGTEVVYEVTLCEDNIATHPWLGECCSHCKKVQDCSEGLCGRCGNVSYCSDDCAKIDWDAGHSTVCAEPQLEFEEEEDATPDTGIGPRFPRGGGGRMPGRSGGGGGRIVRPGGSRGVQPWVFTPRGIRPGRVPTPGRRGFTRFPRGFNWAGYRRPYHPGNWRYLFPALLWGLWAPWYTRWYPATYWYVPDTVSSLPALPAFPPGATPDMVAAMLDQLRQDPQIALIEASGRGLRVVPDAYMRRFVWISETGSWVG